MKLFGKLLIAALVLAVLLPFTIIKGSDGKPLMSLGDLKLPDFSLPEISLPEMNGSKEGRNLNRSSGQGDVIYKWTDENGELHYSTSPPSKGQDFTSKNYDPNTNLIQSIKAQPEEPEARETEASKIEKASDIGNPYSPDKVDKLIKDAQNIEKLLNDRFKKQETLLNN